MKISNNALNFLLAQYRAIFKRAYVKGIASAVLLTAGLAMGQAQAAAENTYVDSVDDLPTTAGQEVTITGKQYDSSTTPAPEGEYTYIQITTSGEKTNFDGTLNIASGSQYNFIYGVSGDVKISGKGTLNIDVTETDITQPSLSITGSGGDVSFDINAVNVNRGKLVLNDTTGTASGSVDIAADSINIGTEGETAELSISATSAAKKVTLGRAADNATKVTGSTITVGATGKLSLATGTGSGAEIVGNLLAITEGGLMITTAGSTGSVKTENFTVDTGSFKVISGSAVSESFVGQNANIHGHFLVDEGTSWVINNTDAKDADNEDYVPSVTFESGADIQLGGTLSISGSTLTVAEGANLVATTGADSHTSGTIVVTKDSDDNAGTLKISSTDLKRFLTAKNGDENVTYQAIVSGDGDNDGKFVVDTESDPTKAAQGSVLLSGTGILELTDTNQIDLATAFTFSGGGTTGKAGNIVVNEGTVKSHNLQVSKAIANVESTHKLSVEADILTIGGSSTATDTESKLSEFKVNTFTAHDEVTLEANDPDAKFFTVDGTLNLGRDYYNKDANGDYITSQVKEPGRILGDDIQIGDASAGGTLTITGGAYTNADGQAMTIRSGTLTISAVGALNADGEADSTGRPGGTDGVDDTTWNYFLNGNPAELVWDGKFEFAEDDDASDAAVEVQGASGANAVLDLTKADITWGSGSITLSGEVEAGSDGYQISKTDYFERAGLGILKLDGDQVISFLGLSGITDAKDDTHLKIEDGGLLLVNGSINDDLDVASAFTSSDTAKQIWLSGGNMFVTGSLSLVDGVNGHGGAADDTADGLTIDGVLGADTISYTNKSTSIDSKKPETDVATVSGGTLAVASSFSSKNHEVKFVSGAGLLLDSKGFLQEWAPETAGEGGTVSVDHLTFSGVEGTDKSTLDVQTGAWTIGSANNLGDVDILDGAILNVGPGHDKFIRTGVGASLALDNLTVTNAASTNSGTVTVDEGGELTLNTIQMAAGAVLNISGGATVTITGDYAHNLSGGKLADGVPEGLTDLGATNVDKQAGINLEGAKITLNSGKFVLGDTAARKLVTLDADAQDGKKAVLNAGLKDAEFKLTGTSELRLDFTAPEGDDPSDGLNGVNGGARLTAQQAKELKQALFGENYTESDFAVGSYINVGDLALGMEYDAENMTADWTKIEDFVQIESDVTNDTVMQLLVQKVDEGTNDLSGQFGAIEASSTTPATVAGSLGLHKAYAADASSEKFFASTVQNGTRVVAGLKVDSDSTLVPKDEIESFGGRVFEIPPYQRQIAYQCELIRLFREERWPIVRIQDAVAFLHGDDVRRERMREALDAVYDIERLSTRITLERATPRDFIALRNSLAALPHVYAALITPTDGQYVTEERSLGNDLPAALHELCAGWDSLEDCTKLLTQALVDSPPTVITDGGLFKPGYHADLDKLMDLVEHGEQKLQEMLEEEQRATGIGKLKLGYNRVFGYFYEVSKAAHSGPLPDHFIRRQTLANAERFTTPALKELEENLLSASDKRKELEYSLFVSLRAHMAAQRERLLHMADVLAQLDYWQSLAHVGRRNGWCRPELEDSTQLFLREGRHPVVEAMVGSANFVPNTVVLDDRRRLCLLTGPNMAGKSTVLRQVAIICLLAQMGSMVPAAEARIGLVDKLFSRVGASDNLAQGQSTFMVEMMETARILRQATRRSLVILDEIGRGTSTYDGVALAWAVVENLAGRLGGIRTFFATHYHELTALEGRIPGVFTMNIAIREHNNEILFLHRLVPGPSDRSYGVEVARLAGVPSSVVQRARAILADLERGRGERRSEAPVSLALPGLELPQAPPVKKGKGIASVDPQEACRTLPQEHPLVLLLRDVEPEKLTPLEALRLVTEWKQLWGIPPRPDEDAGNGGDIADPSPAEEQTDTELSFAVPPADATDEGEPPF